MPTISGGALLVFVAFLALATAVPLQRPSTQVDSEVLRLHVPVQLVRIGPANTSDPASEKHAWVGQMGVGTPAQVFNVTFQPYAGDTWVPDSSSWNRWGTYFNASGSSSYENYNMTFNSTSAGLDGWQGRDIVTFNGTHVDSDGQLAIPYTVFAQVSDFSGDWRVWSEAGVDGVLGLHFKSQTLNKVEPVLKSGFDHGRLSMSVYTVHTDYSRPSTGVWTLGGPDHERCDVDSKKTTTVGTQDKWNGWSVALDSVYMGKKTVKTPNATKLVRIVPDEQFITANASQALKIIKHAKAQLAGSYYTVACNASYSPISFVIANQTLNVTSDTLTVDIGLGDGNCLFAVMPSQDSSGGEWRLGAPFTRLFCTIFDVDYSQVSFAPSLRGVNARPLDSSSDYSSSGDGDRCQFGSCGSSSSDEY